ncbi:MAG: class I SAM-dependent methyltransferase [bacterium]|nr:class I SAM-dependent methyltransferase [bacterium]
MSEKLSPQPEEVSNSYSQKEELESIVRSNRDLEVYKRLFGESLGKKEELILDIGAGDSPMADEIATLSDHKAKVVRLDAGYSIVPPEGEAQTVAADATKIPFADESFDRVVSLMMLPHLGPEKGADVMAEVLRVLKTNGQALLYPTRPFKRVQTELAQKEKYKPKLTTFPTLVITKPDDFNSWDEDKKHDVYEELANYVTYGGTIFKLARYGMAKSIERAGTNRTIEKGSKHSYLGRKKKL